MGASLSGMEVAIDRMRAQSGGPAEISS